jgi:Planctomycete cytochrome C
LKALKKVTPIILSMVILSLVISCKHQIPGDDNTGGGTNGGNNGGNTGGGNNPPVTATCSPDTAYFQQQVLPIFISNCSLSGCHDAASHQDGVVLTNYSGIRAEVRPGDLNDSEIWEKINENDPDDRMPPPPRNPLPQAQKDIIKKWILQGAKNNSCVSASCDTANVSYSTVIKGLISNKCQGCHSGTAATNGYDFSTYQGVKARINDGKLWGAVNHMPGFSPMPKNGNKLSSCELAQVKKWIDAGAPNN